MDEFMITIRVSETVVMTSQGLQGRSPRLRPIRTIPDKLRTVLSRSLLESFWDLIQAGADIESRDRLNRTPLHLVIYWRKELAVVKAVLSAGADPNAIDHHGLSPLHAAIHSNSNPAIIKALICAGADIEMIDLQGRTPLISALQKRDNVAVIRTLLSAGANVKTTNIMVEALKAKVDQEVLRLFLMAGAPVNVTCCGFPPMLYAVLNGDPTIVKMLLVAGAKTDYLHPESRSTLLHNVTVAEIARDLIKHGVSVNAVNFHGETPLHRAVMGDHLDVVMVLLQAGANIHSVMPRQAHNCLHLAKSAPMIRLLASRGVDINARNRLGEIPLQTLITSCSLLLSPLMRFRGLYVRYFKDTNCVKMNVTILAVKEMLRRGANVNSADFNERTVLESVITHGHSKMVAYMIKRDVEVCWQKLFRLNVINQSALQLLIKESLIGNVIVKGKQLFESCPTEEPFLQSVKPLLTYTKRCIEEIELMKKKNVNCHTTTYHYVIEISPKIKPLRLCPHYEVRDEEYTAIFPIYRDQIAGRLNQCYKRGMLLDVLEDLSISAPRQQGKGIVILINDCKLAIAKFLSNRDLVNFIVALGFNGSDDECPRTRSCDMCNY